MSEENNGGGGQFMNMKIKLEWARSVLAHNDVPENVAGITVVCMCTHSKTGKEKAASTKNVKERE